MINRLCSLPPVLFVAITFSTQAPFHLVARWGGMSPCLKAFLDDYPSSVPLSKAQGKLGGHRCLPSPSLLCLVFTALSLHPHCRCPTSGRCAFSAFPAYFLEVVCTADVPVNVFSFAFSQFCYKIRTVYVLLPFRFSKRRLFTAPFPPPRKLPPPSFWAQV